MKNKAVALPINTLVILTMAIVVLISLVAIYAGTTQPTKKQSDSQAKFREECSKWANAGGCTGSAVPAPADLSASFKQYSFEIGVCASNACTGAGETQRIKNACCGG